MAPVPIQVPFCKPDYSSGEIGHLNASIEEGRLEGGGRFTQACEALLVGMLNCDAALVVPSCTAALEMMGLLLDLKPGDEVIMPSFTFVSTANAIALRGAVPVFVDIDPRTLNLDPEHAEAAITPRTKAIMLVHYAGVGCDMDAFERLGRQYDVVLLEDAAQALGATWKGRPLGSFGAYSGISFHHTKNVSCGEGGALVANRGGNPNFAEWVREKGTNRSDFLRGDTMKYEWLVLGSSYLLSELAAAVLRGQLERADALLGKRMRLWDRYQAVFGGKSDVIAPHIPEHAGHNAHIFHLRLPDRRTRDRFCAGMRARGIMASPHYVPLHETPGGQKFGRRHGELSVTVDVTERLVRLPLFSAMSDEQHDLVVASVLDTLAQA